MTYSQVRPETHLTRDYLLLGLADVPQVIDLWHDGSDLIEVTLKGGTKIMVHFIDDTLSPGEVRRLLNDNAQARKHSLLLFWADLLLPNDGERYTPDEWMRPLLMLYSDKLYGYDVAYRRPYIFPVYFRRQMGTNIRLITWGETVHFQDITADSAILQTPTLAGSFPFAEFRASAAMSDDDKAKKGSRPPLRPRPLYDDSIRAHFALLGLDESADLDDVKQAYRALARQFHPDLNPTPQATLKMQELNHAYQALLLVLGAA
jgi:hypothetical protein